MKSLSKNRKKVSSNFDLSKTYNADEAIKILKDNSFVKFDETLDVAIKLNINPIMPIRLNKLNKLYFGIINSPTM